MRADNLYPFTLVNGDYVSKEKRYNNNISNLTEENWIFTSALITEAHWTERFIITIQISNYPVQSFFTMRKAVRSYANEISFHKYITVLIGKIIFLLLINGEILTGANLITTMKEENTPEEN